MKKDLSGSRFKHTYSDFLVPREIRESQVAPDYYQVNDGAIGNVHNQSIISTRKNHPRISIGLPLLKNQPYFRETQSQFVGRDTPSPTHYMPQIGNTRVRAPRCAESRFKRFYVPSSVTNLKQQLPSQYQETKFGKKNRDNYDLMGKGNKFTLKVDKSD